jgi:CcmD family protein
MIYLFWAFAAVWVGIFLYIYGLIRRSQALVREVETLREQSHRTTRPPSSPAERLRGGDNDVPA